jgi:glycosidase
MNNKVLSSKWASISFHLSFPTPPGVWEGIQFTENEAHGLNLPLSEYDLVTVGETPFTHDTEELAAYVLPKNKELNMVFQFELMDIDSPVEGEDSVPLIYKPWKLSDLKDIVRRWQTFKRGEGFWNA